MRALVSGLWLAASLTACSDPVADAERELAIVEKAGGSSDEICAATRKVAEAHLRSQNESQYKTAKLYADIACNRAAIDRL